MNSEMSTMSFESIIPSVYRSMSLDSKVIGYKIRTISELIYKDELVKNMIIEI